MVDGLAAEKGKTESADEEEYTRKLMLIIISYGGIAGQGLDGWCLCWFPIWATHLRLREGMGR